MKVLIYLVLTIGSIFCEVPPPYPPRGFRPSPQLALPQTSYGVPIVQSTRPLQTKYGPPPNNAEPLDPTFKDQNTPIKFTLNNPYRTIPNNIWSANLQQRAPQTKYGPPQISQPQLTYGVPQKQLQSQNTFQPVPQTVYGPPKQINQISQGSGSFPLPQRNYGAPDAVRGVVDAATLEEIRELKQLLQKIEAQRFTQQRNIQYAAPQQNLGFKSQDNGFAQNLPTQNPSNFRNSLSDQYLPVKEPENFKKFVFPTTQDGLNNNFGGNLDQNFRGDQSPPPNQYIPPNQNINPVQGVLGQQGPTPLPSNFGNNPTTSWNNLDLPNLNNGNTQSNNGFPNSVPNVDVQNVEVTQFGPRNRNRNPNVNVATTPRQQDEDLGINGNDDVNNRYIPPSVENPVLRRPNPTTQRPFDTSPTVPNFSADEADTNENPNTAIATAVAAPQDGQQFYLLQPDGSYQRVVVHKRKTKTESDNQYGQNYLLQNVRTEPNILYAPLVSLIR